MVKQISETEARQALAAAGSPAADASRYQASRRDRGWAFSWRSDAGPAPIGSVVWVVSDNGKAQARPLSERVDDLLDQLDREDP